MNYVTPTGFRDVLFDEALTREEATRAVQGLFADRGYMPIETPTLEVMDVMEVGGLGSSSPFKFFDSRGDLLAMRPDVTLQVARMCSTRLKDIDDPLKFRYTQRVFRELDPDRDIAPREMTQIGIECIGLDDPETDAEIVSLFAEALLTAGVKNFSLSLATVGVLRALLDRSGGGDAWKDAVLKAYHASDFVMLDCLCSLDVTMCDVDFSGVDPQYARAVSELARIRGGRDAIDKVRSLVEPLGCLDSLDDFERTYDILETEGLSTRLLIDFSVMSSFDYYTGIVFEAYSPALGTPLGSGGRYDNMLLSYGVDRPAAGFAFFLEQAMAASAADQAISGESSRDASDEPSDVVPGESSRDASDKPSSGAPAQIIANARRPLRIAIPKGSLADDTYRCLADAGLDVSGLEDPGRQLIISNSDVEFIIVRPTDAPIFVALGAADCGICGKDSLLEADVSVVELVDLKYGRCRFVVAEPNGSRDAIMERYRKLGSLRVATKYPRVAADYYAKTGVQVEIVKLHGNIELAPLTGMADRIVDITATGTTLRENNLTIVDEVRPSTARFFANTCAFRTDTRINELAQKLGMNVGINSNDEEM